MAHGPKRRGAKLTAGLALLVALSGTAWMLRGWSQGTHYGAVRELAWWVGSPELAYNWDVAVPGRLFRSGRPDPRFVEYAQERYGVDHLVSLTGASEAHEHARRIGMKVSIFHWPSSRLAPPEELERVLALFESGERVWVHCAGGSDRTGYAIASHRVRSEGWELEQAVGEMGGYDHDAESKPELHEALRAFLSPAAR
jgi:hypothetical protein